MDAEGTAVRDDVGFGPCLGSTHSRCLGCTSRGNRLEEAKCIMTDQSPGGRRDTAGCAVCGQREPAALAMVMHTGDRPLGEWSTRGSLLCTPNFCDDGSGLKILPATRLPRFIVSLQQHVKRAVRAGPRANALLVSTATPSENFLLWLARLGCMSLCSPSKSGQ